MLMLRKSMPSYRATTDNIAVYNIEKPVATECFIIFIDGMRKNVQFWEFFHGCSEAF